nr:hypothetical protein [Thermus thalpophilus]
MDDPLQAMGHKDDPQTKTPSSVVLTLCVVAAMHFGGNHRKTLVFARLWKDLHQAQGYALDTFPLPTRKNIWAQRSRPTFRTPLPWP